MYIQWCVKGIGGRSNEEAGSLPTWDEARECVVRGIGIQSNWFRNKGSIRTDEVARILTAGNLDRHLHDYNRFGVATPFISLACGSVERDAYRRRNYVWSAIDTALGIATNNWRRPGALYYCWVPVAMNPAVEVWSVAESVGELNVYRRWSPYQPEGEVTAKVYIPSNQIRRVEWWNRAHDTRSAEYFYENPSFVHPDPLLNVRDLF